MNHTRLTNGSIRRRNRNTVRDAARRAAFEVLENRQLLSATMVVAGYGTSTTFPQYTATSTWTTAENPGASDYGVTPYFDSTDGSNTNATDLYITQGNQNQATAAWYNTPVPFQNFTATFDYQESFGTAGPADGFAFVLQNDPRSTTAGQGLSTVVGGTGGSLGYSGIQKSIGVQFNIYNGSKTGVGTNGNISDSTGTGSVTLAPQNGQYYGDVIQIQLIYNSSKSTLQEVLTDTSTKQTYSQLYTNINLSSITGGGSTAFLGFTGGTGGAWAYQDITNFTFATNTVPPPPAGAIVGFGSTAQGGQNLNPFVLNGANGQGIDGSATQDNNHGASPTISADTNTLTLTTAATNQASSAFYGAQDIYQNFETKFTYTESGGTTPPANGFTFVLENDSRGANALGGGGADLGYGTDASHPATAISPSIAIEFNNSNSTISLAENGTVIGTAQSTGAVNLGSGDPIAVQIDYNSSAINITLTDTKTNTSMSAPIAFNNLNLPVILGNNLAWVGLTGGTGTGDSLQTISGFSFIPGNAPNPAALAPTPATISGFSGSNTKGLTLNAANGGGLNNSAPSNNNNGQAPGVSGDGNTLTLTTAGFNQASSAFFNTPVAVTNFTTSFTYRYSGGTGAPGQGFAFVLQNDQRGVNAIGGGAEMLGYGSNGNNPAAAIGSSFAAEFNILNNSNQTSESQQGFATNGGINLPQGNFNNTGTVNLTSGDPIKVTLSYDAQRRYVYETVTDTTTKAYYNVGYPINLNSQLGSAAFVGFTGGTAPLNGSLQTISGFTFTTSANTPALPATPTPVSSLNNFGGWNMNSSNAAPGGIPGVSSDNNTLTLTTQNNSEATTAFANTPVTYGNWTASFQYKDVNGGSPADGFTFGMQDVPFLGGGGGSKGYGANATPDTFAITFNIYNAGQTGIGNNSRIVQNTGTGNVNIRSADPINMTFAYDSTAHTITETLVDTTNNNTFSTTYDHVDLTRLLRNAPGAYLGFTGGTGGANATQTFTNFQFTSAANAPAVAGPQVQLGVDYNSYGIGIDGQGLVNGGVDGSGLSNTFFTSDGGTTYTKQVTVNGSTQTFQFGDPGSGSTNTSNGSMINANGQTINLPQGKYGNISLIGFATNGTQSNQPFTVVYTDGSTQTFTQSMSDWFNNGTFQTGETTAIKENYRLDGNGNKINVGANIQAYEYQLNGLDTTKTVNSLVLPNNGRDRILAINVNAVPTVSAVNPNSGQLGGGNTVTITGTGFLTASGVKFGSVAVPAGQYTINSDTSITATVPAGTATGPVDVTVTNVAGTSATGTADKYTYTANVVTPPTLVGSPVINGDNPNGLFNAAGQTTPGQQRSMVEDVVYTFNEAVTITNANAAFTVVAAGPNPGVAPTTLFAQAVAGSNGTQWAVSLTGQAEGTLASIANGEYNITINPNAVFAAADGTTSMAPGTGRSDNFYRLYGDVFGTENVTALDYSKFKQSLNTYNPMFDNYNNGTITALDYSLFKRDLSVNYSSDGFVTSI